MGGHALSHFKQSSHAYFVELLTNRVWDYAGGGYVYRLLQNKTDGKLVEMPNPTANSAERSQIPAISDAEERALRLQKLASFREEYERLLSKELVKQSEYFDRKKQEAVQANQRRLQQLKDSVAKSIQASDEAKKKLSALETSCQRLDASLSRLTALVATKNKKLKSLSMFNATLEQDQSAWVKELEKTRQGALQNKLKNEKIIAQMSAEVEESMRLLM